MASFSRSLVGHHGHGGHQALAAALSRSAPLPPSLTAMAVSRLEPAISGSVRRQLVRQRPLAVQQLSRTANYPPLFSSASRYSSSRGAVRAARFFSSSSAAFTAQPAVPVPPKKVQPAAATPQAGAPSAVSTQRLATAPPTKSTIAATATTPAGRGVVRVGGNGPSAIAMRQSLAEQLGSRPTPTLLYTAPSHFGYRAAGLLIGAFFLVYAVGTMWTVVFDSRPGLAVWVQPAFSVICGLMGGTGIFFIASGRRLVRSIRAVPTAQLVDVAGPKKAARAMAMAGMPAPAAKAPKAAKGAKAAKDAAATAKPPAATAATAADESTPVFLEIVFGRILPLYPKTVMYLPPSRVTFPSRLSQYGLGGGPRASSPTAAASPATTYERVLARRAAQEKQRKARQYEMDHLMTAPFRHFGQSVRGGFGMIQRAMTREGFMNMSANGRWNRLDVTGGWALENGRALDRLVEVKN